MCTLNLKKKSRTFYSVQRPVTSAIITKIGSVEDWNETASKTKIWHENEGALIAVEDFGR